MNYEQTNYGKTGKTKTNKSYIEELVSSDCFLFQDIPYVLTQDYKKDSSRLAISLLDGCSRWLSASTIVEPMSVYRTNEDGHIVPVKPNDEETA